MTSNIHEQYQIDPDTDAKNNMIAEVGNERKDRLKVKTFKNDLQKDFTV